MGLIVSVLTELLAAALLAPRDSFPVFAVRRTTTVATTTSVLVVNTPFVEPYSVVLEKPLVTHLDNIAFNAVLLGHRLGGTVVLDNFGQV